MIQKYDLAATNLTPNFIGSWVIEDALCDELIDFFENNHQKQQQGVSGSSASINLEVKNRIDVRISPKDINLAANEVFRRYFVSLFECYKSYNNDWPFLKKMVTKLDIGAFNLGRYQKGQHFQKIHCERSGLGTLHRMFAFMTYLNTIDKGGATYFNHYDLSIQPKKGLTLIWPAEWTHTHRGNLVESGTKYMITGHLNFAL